MNTQTRDKELTLVRPETQGFPAVGKTKMISPTRPELRNFRSSTQRGTGDHPLPLEDSHETSPAPTRFGSL